MEMISVVGFLVFNAKSSGFRAKYTKQKEKTRKRKNTGMGDPRGFIYHISPSRADCDAPKHVRGTRIKHIPHPIV